MDDRPLLGPDEPEPFALENPEGRSPIVLVCEHGGHRIPSRLGTLGLTEEHRYKHFIWDIGALELARALSQALDAPLAHQVYSRMVCDCNRRPDVESFIPDHGEGIPVPGNITLSEAERDRRRAEVWQPFHDGTARLLDHRQATTEVTTLVTIHSFTPSFYGEPRPWHAGVLYDRDRSLSPALFEVLSADHGEIIGHNEPYAMGRDSDYTVPVHGEDRDLPSVEIEVRNDLIGDASGRAQWAERLAAAIGRAHAEIGIDIGADTRADVGNQTQRRKRS